TTNVQSISQTISPLIATAYLQLGGVFLGFIYLNSYQLIGFTNIILAVILFLVAYIDVENHPNLYSWEKMLKKKKS
ncbi:MAG: hypothetical protein KGD58_15640, partial [Candidatus Lokiarchaeota archaeon]|nr:hypothetical protein [Candidatus Lokiarchaeota archaeon]